MQLIYTRVYVCDRFTQFDLKGESVQLYDCTTSILTNSLKKKVDGNYTKILRGVLRWFWKVNEKKEREKETRDKKDKKKETNKKWSEK